MEVVSCLGSLVQSCCGEGEALQTDIAGVCGEHSQCSGHTGFAPAHGCVLSPSTLLRLLAALYGAGPCVACSSSFGVLHKSTDSVGPAFCAFPARAAQAARSLMGALSPGVVHLIPSTVPASVSMHTGPVCLVSVLGSWSLAVTLPADVKHPASQEVFG